MVCSQTKLRCSLGSSGMSSCQPKTTHEHDALKGSAPERKQAIQAKIDALNS